MSFNNYAFMNFLILQIGMLGKDRTFGSLTLDELNELAKAFEAFSIKQSASDNEPPF